jgi:hypothetical protein
VQFATNEPAARAKTISDGPREAIRISDPVLPAPARLPHEERAASTPPSLPPSAAVSVSSEATRSVRRRSGVALALAIALALALTIFISTSRRNGEVRTERAPATEVAPHALTHAPLPPPPLPPETSIAEVAIDAGTPVELAPPPETRAVPEATHVRVRRTPAEEIGLESNPYGPR